MLRSLLAVMWVSRIALADPPANPALQQLISIGRQAQPKQVGFSARCIAPSKSEAAALEKVAVAWIDKQFPAEHDADTELVFGAGCKDTHTNYVSVGQDRVPNMGDGPLRRNFILAIAGDTVVQIATRPSTYSQYWMEWADEGSYSIVAMTDVDGDGSSDLVWADNQHEGGASATTADLFVRFANNMQTALGHVNNLIDVQVVAGQLVIAGQALEDQRIYACVGRDLRLARCAASATLQRATVKRGAAVQLANLRELPDRELGLSWLAAIGAKAPATVIAALPATTPADRAQRHVDTFLEAKQLDRPFDAVFSQPQPHLEAIAFLAQLATTLGDKPCTATALSDEARAKLTAWARSQDKHGVESIEVEAACGTYAWAAWNRKGDPARTESLVTLAGSEPVRVAKFPVLVDQGGPFDHHATTEFFQHGDTVIGVVIRNDNLAVIANGKIVAQSHGSISRYTYDDRWPEHSRDLIVDSGTVMHPIPTGIEKLDRELIKDHEIQRNALGLVLNGTASHDPAYLAALHTVGADAKLVAECKAL